MNIKNALLGATSPFIPPLGVLLMAAPTIAELEARVIELNAESEEFRTRMANGEDLSDEDAETIEANAAELEKLTRRIKALKLLEPQGQGRRTAPEPQNRDPASGSRGRTVAADPRRDDARHGMRSFGTFVQAVLNHYRGNVTDDVTRLRNAATTYGGEGIGTDGG